MRPHALKLLLLTASLATAGALAQDASAPVTDHRASPEAATVAGAAAPVRAERFMAVTAHPLATRAAREILREGGSAADAAIAAQAVLGLVEPQSSGLGGGAFALYWDGVGITSIDGRETAPAAATPERFLDAEGNPRKWPDMVPGGLSVGVPGALAMYGELHARHGKLPWPRLFQYAYRLAREGFGVSPRLSALLSDMGPDAFSPRARDYFFDAAGEAWPLGHVLRNPDYAATLLLIASEGAAGFYRGAFAAEIAETVRDAWNNPGDLTVTDMADYRAIPRKPVCFAYSAYRVCGMGPPSSGGLAVGMTLAMLEGLDLGDGPDARALHLIAEAEKLAFADRNAYVGDPAMVTVPEGLSDPAYLASRAALIDPARSMGAAAPGTPPGLAPPAGDATKEAPGTSQISIVDADGNAVSITTTIESAFGSRLMVHGFLLNNELTDFSFKPADEAGRPAANRVEGGKRPRSSMAPTLVFRPDGSLFAVLGSPGGSRIIPYVVKAVVALIDWNMDPQQAAALANFGSRNGPFEIEDGVLAMLVRPGIEARGHEWRIAGMTSGLNIIVVGKGLAGGSDPRREGAALGD
ncbi:MAG: gamma-glutamyltransferase family protein [Flavobacteriaceae bacterium]